MSGAAVCAISNGLTAKAAAKTIVGIRKELIPLPPLNEWFAHLTSNRSWTSPRWNTGSGNLATDFADGAETLLDLPPLLQHVHRLDDFVHRSAVVFDDVPFGPADA